MKIGEIIGVLIIGVAIGTSVVMGWFKNNPNIDTVQQRTLITLELIGGDLTVCKTKNYTAVVKIVDKDKDIGHAYPLVSMNGSAFLTAKAFGDIFGDGEEFVFYHDAKHAGQSSFKVRFQSFIPNENQKGKVQCYIETRDEEDKRAYEYGNYSIRKDPSCPGTSCPVPSNLYDFKDSASGKNAQ